ncbi:MAG: ribbon-helix-helix domain-containing protein [Pseudoprimorskyibacter sp.]|nr:ribbon-helix-helix domain-containing protein [Pseudoprimorskyibacter sp.]
MNDRPVKRSVTLRGHRTSVTLEPLFWQALKDIARERRLAVNALAAEIDSQRDLETGLATALRVYILDWYRSRSR